MKHYIVYNTNFERSYGRLSTLEAAKAHREAVLRNDRQMVRDHPVRPEDVVIFEAVTVWTGGQ